MREAKSNEKVKKFLKQKVEVMEGQMILRELEATRLCDFFGWGEWSGGVGCLKRKYEGKKGAQQIIRCKKCAYHSPDKEAYLLKGRVCEPFARAWNCYVRTCCQKQPGHGRPH